MFYDYEILEKHKKLKEDLGLDPEGEDFIGGAKYYERGGYLIEEPKEVETYAKVFRFEDYRTKWLLPTLKKGEKLPVSYSYSQETNDGRVYEKDVDFMLVYSKDLTPIENALLVREFLENGIYTDMYMEFFNYHLQQLNECLGQDYLVPILLENLDLECEEADKIKNYIKTHPCKKIENKFKVRNQKEEELFRLIERGRNLKEVEKMADSILKDRNIKNK